MTSSNASERSNTPWIFATIALAVIAVGAIIGLFVMKGELDKVNTAYAQLQASSSAQVAKLTGELDEVKSGAKSADAARAEKIARLEQKVQLSQAKLQIGGAVIKQGGKGLIQMQKQLKAANKRYQAAKVKAAKDKANLKLQLTASEAQAQLAEQCATVMGVGLLKLYQDSPTIVTYQEVKRVMKVASAACQGVTVPTP